MGDGRLPRVRFVLPPLTHREPIINTDPINHPDAFTKRHPSRAVLDAYAVGYSDAFRDAFPNSDIDPYWGAYQFALAHPERLRRPAPRPDAG